MGYLLRRHRIPKAVRPGVCDTLFRCVEWYGFHKLWERSRLEVYEFGQGFRKIVWNGKTIIIPKVFSVKRLISIIVELDVAINAHYFFHRKFDVAEGRWIIDVGACEGLFAILCHERWPGAMVMAIEPSPTMSSALGQTVVENRCSDKVQIIQCLLGATEGEALFEENLADLASSRVVSLENGQGLPGVRVAVRTIDKVCIESGRIAGAIKMDAEGAELEILKGAEQTLRRDRPILMITTYHNRDDAFNIAGWLRGLGVGYNIEVRGITSLNESAPRPVMLFAFGK